jgi:hypothetical protein
MYNELNTAFLINVQMNDGDDETILNSHSAHFFYALLKLGLSKANWKEQILLVNCAFWTMMNNRGIKFYNHDSTIMTSNQFLNIQFIWTSHHILLSLCFAKVVIRFCKFVVDCYERATNLNRDTFVGGEIRNEKINKL